mmetsp:Transcript_7491/g.13960  ORF Transcript_7491/g.13960 Transcript_7491/m.13960 type:complete len:192 (-) Transcript_7491:232-807(-)
MEVQNIVQQSERQTSRGSLATQMAIGFALGFIGVMAISMGYSAVVGREDPSLGLAMAQSTTFTRPMVVAPHMASVGRQEAWVADARLRKRDRQAEAHRKYNKAIKSAVRTRTKKALRAIEEAKKGGISAETDLASSDKLMSEAYKQIDKAVSKGVMKPNTGARQKSRIATWRQKLLIESGLYTPVVAAAAA